MTLNTVTRTLTFSTLFAALVFAAICAATATAQDTSKMTVTPGTPEQQITVEHGEVVYVSGNDVVIKNTVTGEVRHFVAPESARAMTEDGQEISVHDLKPGMKLQRTITTTTTPRTVTTVRTIQGVVQQIMAPTSVILRLPDGTNKRYKIPKDQKFNINGKEVDAFHLHKGMNVTATVVTETPATEIAQHQTVTVQAPSTPPIQGALLVEEVQTETAQTAEQPANTTMAAAQPAKQQLPQTGSELPLLGLLGFFLAGAPIGLKLLRNRL